MLHPLFLFVGLSFSLAAHDAPLDEVGPQGVFLDRDGAFEVTSPGGRASLSIHPVEGDFCHLACDLLVRTPHGTQRLLHVHGQAFFVTDQGRVIAIESTHSEAVPSRVTVFAADGSVLHTRRVPVFSDPALAPDGGHLVYRSRGAIVALDLATFAAHVHPNVAPFAPLAGGGLVGALPGGELTVRDAHSEVLRVPLGVQARRIATHSNGAYILTRGDLRRLDLSTGALATLYQAPPAFELRDLRVAPDALHVGSRRSDGRRSIGHALLLRPDGTLRGVTQSAPTAPLASDVAPGLVGAIPWPLTPNAQHPIGNTYGEYQRYGGSPYMHPGIDVMGSDGQPVYAVAGGVVKAVLTTSGQYHWRVAIADEAGAGTSAGYLYAHLDLPTIAVNVGDVVAAGQYLGDLVAWPVAGFTHCHFARIEDTGAQWFGDWLCTNNPHVRLASHAETEPPVFENAVGADLFAFCTNETSDYQDPSALSGSVDIIVHVGDRIASTWVCTVQELRYTIHPLGLPGAPVVDDRLALRYDMELDTYQDGPFDEFLVDLLYKQDATCDTEGDYGDREFFHVLTNSNGDQVYDAADQAQAWDTTQVPNGAYVIDVTAVDAAGNSASAAMTVTVLN